MKYLIFMDVSGDINIEAAGAQKLKFIPMEYSLGDEMRTCEGMENSDILKKFYDGQRNGDLTKTSQISPYLYEQYLEPYFEQGYSVLYLCLSSGLSSTFQSACMARTSLKEKYPQQDFYPVDSLSATGGMGVLAERALRNKNNGMELEENYEDLCQAAKHMKHWFMVQDLMYLKRGGRISAATAVVGSALNVKPILKIDENGKLETFAKKRGNKAAVKALLENFSSSYDEKSGDVIYIIDADAQDMGDYLEAEVKKLYSEAVVRRSMLSPIIGAHTGPGMAAICHMGK